MSYEGVKLAPARLPTTVPLTTAVNAFSNKITFPTAVSNVVSTNLHTNSDGAVTTYSSRSNVTDAPGTISGFTNAVAFGDNTLARYAYKTNFTTVSGTTYTFSAYVVMDDGSAPVVGGQTSSADFCVVIGNSLTLVGLTVTQVSGTLYRISGVRTASSVSGNCGIVKYTQNSAKTFKVTGYQLEEGSAMTDYIPTTSAAVTRNEFETTGLLKSGNGLTVSAGTITLPAASISDTALSSNVGLLTGTQTFSGAKTFSAALTASAGLSVTGTASATTFSGSGASLTSLNASNLSSGTVADARLSSNVVLLTGTQTITGNKTFSGAVTLAADPTSDLHAATKQYVDSKSSMGTVSVVTSLASAYNAVSNSVLLVKLTAAATANIVFPASAAAGDQIIVKDASGNFATYNVTIARSGTDTIEGDTSILLNLNRMSVTFVSDGSGGWWLI